MQKLGDFRDGYLRTAGINREAKCQQMFRFLQDTSLGRFEQTLKAIMSLTRAVPCVKDTSEVEVLRYSSQALKTFGGTASGMTNLNLSNQHSIQLYLLAIQIPQLHTRCLLNYLFGSGHIVKVLQKRK